MPNIKLSKRNLGILLLVISLTAGVLAFLIGNNIKFLQLGYLGVFAVNLIGSATIILPIPSFATTIAAGAFLNPVLIAFLSALGSTIGELTGYYAGIGGREFIRDNKKIQKVKMWMDRYGLWLIMVLAIIPNPFFDVAGAISGASGLPLRKYLIVVFSGKLIKFLILAYAGLGFLKLFKYAF
jgi:uncharacterized membrane protein YdjX (TVP38/TMEM64 family)